MGRIGTPERRNILHKTVKNCCIKDTFWGVSSKKWTYWSDRDDTVEKVSSAFLRSPQSRLNCMQGQAKHLYGSLLILLSM